jgi:hypothetical protein
VLADFKKLSTRRAERWATVHFAWRELRDRGRPFTSDDVVREVVAWKGQRGAFKEDKVRQTLEELLHARYVTFDHTSVKGK